MYAKLMSNKIFKATQFACALTLIVGVFAIGSGAQAQPGDELDRAFRNAMAEDSNARESKDADVPGKVNEEDFRRDTASDKITIDMVGYSSFDEALKKRAAIDSQNIKVVEPVETPKDTSPKQTEENLDQELQHLESADIRF